MSTTTAAAPLTPKATRITKEAATTLLQYFTLAKWPLNKSLPRSDLHGDLAAIAKKYGLTKKQVARQLKSYKEKKYRMKDVVLDFSPERIKKMLEEGIGMEPAEVRRGDAQVRRPVWNTLATGSVGGRI